MPIDYEGTGGILEWTELAAAASDVVTSLAVLVAGAWAYFRFVRGRTFARRAEMQLTASLLTTPVHGLHVVATMKNTGASKVEISNVVYAEVHGVTAEDWPERTNVDWGDVLISTRLLQEHGWIESLETVADEALIPVPHQDEFGDEFVAYRVLVHAVGVGGRFRPTTSWSAQTVVLRHAEPDP